MKILKRHFVLLISIALLLPFGSFSQSDFYYTFENEREYLTQIDSKWVVEFHNGLKTENHPGKKINNNVFVISDMNELNKYEGKYQVIPAYKTKKEEIEVYLTSKMVLKFKQDVSKNERLSLIENYNLKLEKETLAYDLYTSENVLETSQQVYESGLVEFCHPDFICPEIQPLHIPNDEYFNKQFYLHNTGQQINDGHSGTTDADIDAPEAWDITKGSPDIVVAVVDEGVTSNHPDLPNSRQVRLNGSNIASSVDGTSPNDPSPVNSSSSGNNHGNACAGIIAATQDNNIGVSGVAPHCKIMPVRVAWGQSSSHYADAIIFAHNNGAEVISNSWGGGSSSPLIISAIQNAINDGIVVVFAAGNTANHASNNNGYVSFPGNAAITDLITVGASDRNNVQANYSPTDTEYEIVAPSHKSYNSQISGEAFDVWTIDIPGNYGYNKWRDSWSSPLPAVGEFLPSTGTDPYSYTGRMGGTSAATPQVAGVAALMLSLNSCLNPHEVKSILQQTADKVGTYNYNWSSTLPGHSKEMGYGKLNAHGAVQEVLNTYSPPLDLFMRDRLDDSGADAGYQWTWHFDDSPDVWVRNQDDGMTNHQHQNPEYSSTSPVYVYVRVGNRSCIPSSGDEELSLYWSKASSDASWPLNWDGSSPYVGDNIGTLNIPALLPGESTILKFTWNILNPNVHNNWESCLLARIENSPYDPITLHYDRLSLDVYNNNNVSLRNCIVTDIFPGKKHPYIDGREYPYGGFTLVGNTTERESSFDVIFTVPEKLQGTPITEEAKVTLTFDDLGWEIMERHFYGRDDIRIIEEKTIEVLGQHVAFNEIHFPAYVRIPVYVGFSFYNDDLGEKNEFKYHVIQKYTERHPELGDNWTGGVHYYISRLERSPFKSGFDAENGIAKENSKFEFGARIESLTPNPANDKVVVSYNVGNAMSAYIMVLETASTKTSSRQILNCSQSQTVLDVSTLKSGVYTVMLVCDGQFIESKKLVVQ